MDLNEIYKVTKDSRREEFEVAFEKIKKDFICPPCFSRGVLFLNGDDIYG